MSDEGPRHFAKGPNRRSRPEPAEPASGPVPPRLRESERLRERMRAQGVGPSEELPPPVRRPDPPQDAPRLPAWLTPVALGAVALLSAFGAIGLDRSAGAEAEAIDDANPTTPVLSARRVPELLAAPVANARLQADLSAWMAQSPPSSCLAVQSGDETLFAQKEGEPLTGASTQKLVTGTAALVEMGPDARLDTVASTAAPPADGVISGDLFVIGAGDPVLTTPQYAQQLYRGRLPSLATDPAKLADAIKAAGVTRIEGSVVGDGSRYDNQTFHPSWPERFRPQHVVGPLSALMVNDGFADFPQQFAGTQARGPAPDPAQHAALVLTTLLRERGVTVIGPPKSGRAPQEATLTTVASLPSATMEEIVGEMLVESDNDTAEMLLKELGRRESGVGSWEAGAAAATKILTDAGVDMNGVEIVDGSGLSTANRLSCRLLLDLLTRPGTGPLLVENSAVAGESGTLADRWQGTPVQGRMHAKTGTLRTVTALAGRVEPLQGGSLTFSYVANVPEPQAIDNADVDLQNGLASILVEYPRGVDVDALQPAPVEGG